MATCKIITNCRLCDSENLEDLLDFGLIAPANNYIKPEDIDKEEEKFNLSICRCKDCYHVQLKETINKESLFSNYLYASSTSGSLAKYFEQYTTEIIEYLKLKPENGYILDLGSNDGVTLQHFKYRGFQVLGVEPASNLALIAEDKDIQTINTFFGTNIAKYILETKGYPQVILSSNTYAHLENHNDFTEGIKILLNNKNCFIFENAALYDTIKGLYFDQIYHDHLSFFWTVPLIRYFDNKDLRIFHIIKTPIQGGSNRVFVCKNSSVHKRHNSFLDIAVDEIEFGLHKKETFLNFKNNLEMIKINFISILKNEIQHKNKTVSCYGCPAKFALFSKFFGLNKNNVKYVVDDSKFKQGLLAPESKIPIVSREHFIQNPTDICIISAWNFADFIKKNNQQYNGIWLNPFELELSNLN